MTSFVENMLRLWYMRAIQMDMATGQFDIWIDIVQKSCNLDLL